MRIFLLGFMGSGKSYTGRLLAKHMDLPYVDLDDQIEAMAKASIPEIFNHFGEKHFRNLERDALHQMTTHTKAIISCGGGTPCFFDNMDWMNAHGVTIYLDASPETLQQRLIDQQDHRPLLKNKTREQLLEFIQKKIEERQVYYHQAHYIVRQETFHTDTVSAILQLLNRN